MENILVIGSSNTDMIIKTDRLPRPGETVGNGDFSVVNGGKGANQAVAAARAGGQVTFITCIGDDLFGGQQLENFRQSGIDTEHVFTLSGIPTGTALIMIDSAGENCIAVAPGANGQMQQRHLDKADAAFDRADWVLLQLEVPLETVGYATRKAESFGARVILNPAPASALPDELLARVHTLVVNETEAALLAECPVENDADIRKAAQKLLTKVQDTVIITLGAGGSFVAVKEKEPTHVPAKKVKAVDTTAAGDVFCGTLVVALSEGKEVVDAVQFATAAAALAVTKLGAQPSAPRREEIMGFL